MAMLLPLRQALHLDGKRGALISAAHDVRWVTRGFIGDGMVLVTRDGAWLITDSRWNACPDSDIATRWCDGSFIRCAADLCLTLDLEALYIQLDDLPVARYRRLKEYLDGATALLPMNQVTDELRAVKSEDEVRLIRRACGITCEAFRQIVPELCEGISEQEAAWLLNAEMMRRGADGLAFPTMVSFGENTARCHAMPTERRLRPGDAVLIDMGCTVAGYHADFTRILCMGEPSEQLIRLHQAVLLARSAALNAIRPDANAGAIDHLARKALTDAGFDSGFPHALGHGVGLEIHEQPSISTGSRHTLREGMTLAVEPAVYMPDLGVRIEDTLLLTASGPVPLTEYPTDILIL